MSYPKLIEQLIEAFVKFPGIGRRSAERIVFWLLNQPQNEVNRLCQNIEQLKENLRFCADCQNLTDQEVCVLCSNPHRDHQAICVVENAKDLLAIERSGAYKGLYYVLWGALAPTEGRGPEDLKLDSLFQLIQKRGIKELIIATDPDTEGEMTAIYISNQAKPLGIKLTRIGFGIPMGSAVEYADLSTLSISLTSRREIN